MKNEAAHDRVDSSDADEEVEGYRKVGNGKYEKGGKMYSKSKDGKMTYKSVTAAEDLDEDDLQKALDAVVASAEEGSEVGRKETLLQKAIESDLDEDEKGELIALMGGGTADEDTLSKSATAALDSHEGLKKSVEVSEFLEGIAQGVYTGLETLADHIEKSDNRQGEFNVILAKAIREVGLLTKSLDNRLENIEAQPAGRPRAIQSTKQLEKGFQGEAPEGDRISKSQALDVMEHMNIDALQKGHKDKSEAITKAIAKYESTNHMSKAMFKTVMAFRAQLRNNAA